MIWLVMLIAIPGISAWFYYHDRIDLEGGWIAFGVLGTMVLVWVFAISHYELLISETWSYLCSH